jgi:hypothetical protein
MADGQFNDNNEYLRPSPACTPRRVQAAVSQITQLLNCIQRSVSQEPASMDGRLINYASSAIALNYQLANVLYAPVA